MNRAASVKGRRGEQQFRARCGQHPVLYASNPSMLDTPVDAFFHPEGTAHALLVGVNRYVSAPDLKGACNDAKAWRHLLLTSGWKMNNIKVLEDGQATKAKVIRGLRWLLSGRGPKDSLLFHFSGHGSWTRTPEGWQCCICCADYSQDGDAAAGVITNTEYQMELVRAPAGVTLLCVLDSCFSGGMSPNCRPLRRLPAQVRKLLFEGH